MQYDRDQGDTDIWVMNADGSGMHALTTNGVEDNNPVWSPDGSRIAFTNARDGSDRSVYTMAEDGSDVVRLTYDYMVDFVISDWSPDGTHLLGTLDGSGGDPNFYEHSMVLVDATTGQVTRLTDVGDASGPTFSPDGSQIIWSATSSDGTGQDLFVANRDGFNATVLASTPGHDERHPRWSPDGSKIAYFASPCYDPADCVNSMGPHSIFVMNVDGTGSQQLTFSRVSSRDQRNSSVGQRR